MKQLTIKELAPYLPYGLKVIEESTNNISEVDGLFNDNAMHLKRTNRVDYFHFYPNIKPILRSLSDLIKEIEHNGEKFVPIEWLYNNLVDDSDVVDFDYTFKEEIKPTFQIDDGWNFCMTLVNDSKCFLCYSYDSNSKSFLLSISDEDIINFEWCTISNQYDMFQKLFEWHFDIFELLENNLAIDINTLK